jgi:predicted phosphodiesterase
MKYFDMITQAMYMHADARDRSVYDAVRRCGGSCRLAAECLCIHKSTPSKVMKRMYYAGLPVECEPVMISDDVIGIIGDTHIPYEHKGYLQFCKDTFDRYGVTRVIHIGDLIDNHALSFHDSEPSLVGANGERERALAALQPWYEAFPNLTWIRGNHDLMANRKALKLGIDPEVYLRPICEVYGMPKGWHIEERVIINGVIYHHGETAMGVNGFRNDAKQRMMNSACGHNHSNFGVSYTANDHRMVWGMAVGCGVDNDSMAFAYGKNFKNKPVVGCGIVMNNGKLPICVPMDLGEKW